MQTNGFVRRPRRIRRVGGGPIARVRASDRARSRSRGCVANAACGDENRNRTRPNDIRCADRESA
ncbi:hypothetical protein DR62_07235 [Burkholderia thailandensis]|nr:hypothetical protein DR62_07235 [Burkholderia thailandensis]AOI54429.1 hypothetical protein WI24_21530 [Burkholderia thailandensis]AOJ53409.1 hypothetical protein AQ475_21340 [Burkholderia thailandensis]AOJ59358.1 hypothetical protein AQ477_22665 [Burkholderia thailandensis]AVR28465.1 hypothetical protein A8H32_26685 [Burkholderia thailandensis]